MQNYCKSPYFYIDAFPSISEDLLGLLHGCCALGFVGRVQTLQLNTVREAIYCLYAFSTSHEFLFSDSFRLPILVQSLARRV